MAPILSHLPPEVGVLFAVAFNVLVIYGFMRLFVRMLKK